MRLRGQDWLRLAQRFEDFDPVKPAARPAPMPPATGRLTSLSVTQVKTLIRDPYAIYARHILKLSPLAPIDPQPDPLLRGVILHEIYEDFVKNWEERSEIHHREVFFNIAQDHLAAIPWAAARLSWLAMLEASIDWFIAGEIKRRKAAIPQLFEHRGIANIPELGITLKAKADRIDIAPDGRVALYDYKTGTPPSEKVQRLFDKQLLIEAAMIFQSGFGELPPREVFHAAYLGLGRRPTEIKAPIAQETPRAVWQGLLRLLTQYAKAEQGFTARRALQSEQDISEYDHLARFGEWDITDMPMPMKVGDHA